MTVAGACPSSCGVVCRIIARDRDRETGVDVTAGQLAISRDAGDVFLTVESDPSTVERLCFGEDVPVLDEREVPGNRASYTYCPIWQAEHAREDDGRAQLAGGGLEDVPQPVSHWDDGRGGMRSAPAGSSWDADDPWKQARRDLDLLDPPASEV